MLRRKPTRIELKLEDAEELELKKEMNTSSVGSQAGQQQPLPSFQQRILTVAARTSNAMDARIGFVSAEPPAQLPREL